MASVTRTHSPTVCVGRETSLCESPPAMAATTGQSTGRSDPGFALSSSNEAGQKPKNLPCNKLSRSLPLLQPRFDSQSHHSSPKTSIQSACQCNTHSDVTYVSAQRSLQPDLSLIAGHQDILGGCSIQVVEPTHTVLPDVPSLNTGESAGAELTSPSTESVLQWRKTIEYEASAMNSLGKNRYHAHRLAVPLEATARFAPVKKMFEADVRRLVASVRSSNQILWSCRLCMVGSKTGTTISAEPTILISCGSLKGKRKIKSGFQRIRPHYLENLGMPLIVSYDKSAPVLAGIFGMPSDEEDGGSSKEVDVIFLQQSDSATCCGLKLAIKSYSPELVRQAYATLGGIIKVGDSFYGVTTAHPIISSRLDMSKELTHDDLESLSDSDEFSDSSDDEDVCTEARQLHNHSAQLQGHHPEVENSHSSQNLSSLRLGEVRPGCPVSFSFDGVALSSLGSVSIDPIMSDWALLKVPDSHIRPNSYVISSKTRRDETSERLSLNSVVESSQIVSGAVHVLWNDETPQLGHLSTNLVSLHLDRGALDVYEIFLEKPISIGISGSWVVKEDRLVGIVVALSNEGLSCHALPMWQVFESIQAVCGQKVELVNILPSPATRATETELDFPGRFHQGRVPILENPSVMDESASSRISETLTDQSNNQYFLETSGCLSTTDSMSSGIVKSQAKSQKSLREIIVDSEDDRETAKRKKNTAAAGKSQQEKQEIIEAQAAEIARLKAVASSFKSITRQDLDVDSNIPPFVRPLLLNTDAGAALGLVLVLAVLAQSDFPLQILEEALKKAEVITRRHFTDDNSDSSLWLVEQVEPLKDVSVGHTLHRLIDLHLVRLSSWRAVTLYSHVYAWARDRQSSQQKSRSLVVAACLMALSDGSDLWRNGHGRAQLRPHLLRLVDSDVSNFFEGRPPRQVTEVLLRCARLMASLDLREQIFSFLKSILAALKLDPRSPHENWLLLYDRYAWALHLVGDDERALQLVRRIIAVQSLSRRAGYSLRLSTELLLSGLAIRKGGDLLEKMIPALESRWQELTASSDHGYRVAVAIQLSQALIRSNKASEAADFLRKAHGELCTGHLDSYQLFTLEAALGIACSRIGRWEQAIGFLTRVVKFQKLFAEEGENQRLWNQCHLARALCGQGRYGEASEQIERVVAAFQTNPGTGELIKWVQEWRAYLKVVLQQAPSTLPGAEEKKWAIKEVDGYYATIKGPESARKELTQVSPTLAVEKLPQASAPFYPTLSLSWVSLSGYRRFWIPEHIDQLAEEG